jgi:acetyl esterase/lipase
MKNTSTDRVAIEEGVAVGTGGGRQLRADVFTPPAGTANGIGVLLIHGGGWRSGDRTQLRGYGILLGRVGFTSVACEYRLTDEATWPAQIEDVRTAFRWTREHAKDLDIDANSVAVSGNSAGAHLSLMLAGMPDDQRDVAACVAIYGPALLADPERRYPENDRIVALFGEADAEVRRQASPLTYASASFPPTMLIHGTEDELVPVASSERLYRALRDAGAKAELHIFNGQKHAFDQQPDYGRLCANMISVFLKRHVLAPAAVK